MANEFKIKNGAIISGSITGITEAPNDNSTKMASTEWVKNHVLNYIKTDYDPNITGSRNSVNKVFTLSNSFTAGTTRVYINGMRLTPGAEYDYVETNTNQIAFINPPDVGDQIVVDYIKL